MAAHSGFSALVRILCLLTSASLSVPGFARQGLLPGGQKNCPLALVLPWQAAYYVKA